MPPTTQLSVVVLFVAILLLSVDTCKAQVSDYNLIKQCPEGCRDVDKKASCGSPSDARSCEMAIDGNVTMRCKNGNNYTLDIDGCHSQEKGGDNDDGLPDLQETAHWIMERTILIGEIVNNVYVDHLLIAAIVQCVLWGWLMLIGYRLRRVTAVLVSCVFGIFFGLCVAVAAMDRTSSTWTWLSMAGFGVLFALPGIGGSIRSAGPFVGMANGAAFPIVALAFEMHFERSSYHIIVPLLIIGSTVIGAVHGVFFPKPAIVLSCIIFTFVCSLDAVSIFVHGKPVFTAHSESGVSKLYIPLGVAGGCAILCTLIQLYWRRKMRRHHMEEESTLFLGGGDGGAENRKNWSRYANNGYGATESTADLDDEQLTPCPSASRRSPSRR